MWTHRFNRIYCTRLGTKHLDHAISGSFLLISCYFIYTSNLVIINLEYALGVKNTTEGDVYSYGVLLLQMITGKRPTDEIFKDGLNLHNFVYAAFPERISEILDANLLQELSDTGCDSEEQNCAEAWMHGCIIPLLKVGLLCCMELPRQRLRIGDVCSEVAGIKDEYLMSLLQLKQRNGY